MATLKKKPPRFPFALEKEKGMPIRFIYTPFHSSPHMSVPFVKKYTTNIDEVDMSFSCNFFKQAKYLQLFF